MTLVVLGNLIGVEWCIEYLVGSICEAKLFLKLK